MEGYSFCIAASRFSLSDYIQVIKIISDNEQKPVSELTKRGLKNAIASGAEATIIIEAFLDFAREEASQPKPSLPSINTSRLHFTESQKIRLSQLTSQMHLLDPSFDVFQEIAQHKTSSSVLNHLEKQVRLCQSRIIND